MGKFCCLILHRESLENCLPGPSFSKISLKNHDYYVIDTTPATSSLSPVGESKVSFLILFSHSMDLQMGSTSFYLKYVAAKEGYGLEVKSNDKNKYSNCFCLPLKLLLKGSNYRLPLLKKGKNFLLLSS